MYACMFCDLFYVHVCILFSSVGLFPILRYTENNFLLNFIGRLYIKLKIVQGNHIFVYFEIYVERNRVSKIYIRLQKQLNYIYIIFTLIIIQVFHKANNWIVK